MNGTLPISSRSEVLKKVIFNGYLYMEFTRQPFSIGSGTDQQLPEEAALHEVLDMMSCKAAIKAGDKMSEQELAALLAKRDEIERSSNCPHGRPTTLRLTLKDLERQFGRS